MQRRSVLATGAAALALSRHANAAGYPERPITLICPWGAGGGTDATSRIVASILERELGVPVNVVNRTGGSGVVGHSAIATAAPDGYTLGIITVEIGMMHWQGLTELSYKDYTPLALMNEDPAGLQVRADSSHDSAKGLLEAARGAGKGELKASGTGQGGIWHLALAGMLQAGGMTPDQVQWVPSQGAAPGLQDLVAGGVDLVTCSVPEAKSLIDAGKVRSLAVMSEQRNAAFPDVPTLKEATGLEWVIGAWRGFAGPKDLPAEVTGVLVPALAKAYESPEFKDFMGSRGFGTIYAEPARFETFMAERDASLGAVMKGLGLAS
jgi:tripartite-type tricarboxylate transporter receptor subunit TctC